MTRGARLEKSLAGDTTLAAMLVDSVAMARPTRPMATTSGDENLPTRTVGSQMTSPKMMGVALVTAAPMNENRVIVAGSPIVWPQTWSRCERQKREKSG